MLLTLRGTPFLYYGDELGLPEVRDGLADGARPGRQAHRRPVAQPRPLPDADAVERRARRRVHAADGATPWLPFGDLAAHNVAAQRADRGSQLWLTRDLIALRREEAALRTGAYARARRAGRRVGLAARRRVRGRRSTCRTRRPRWPASTGTVAIGTDRARDGEAVDGALALGPWEGALVRVG